jgi:hypothetical protein
LVAVILDDIKGDCSGTEVFFGRAGADDGKFVLTACRIAAFHSGMIALLPQRVVPLEGLKSGERSEFLTGHCDLR